MFAATSYPHTVSAAIVLASVISPASAKPLADADDTSIRPSLPNRKLPGATSATTRSIPGCRSARGTGLQRIVHSAALCASAGRSINNRLRFMAAAMAARSSSLPAAYPDVRI